MTHTVSGVRRRPCLVVVSSRRVMPQAVGASNLATGTVSGAQSTLSMCSCEDAHAAGRQQLSLGTRSPPFVAPSVRTAARGVAHRGILVCEQSAHNDDMMGPACAPHPHAHNSFSFSSICPMKPSRSSHSAREIRFLLSARAMLCSKSTASQHETRLRSVRGSVVHRSRDQRCVPIATTVVERC